MGAARDEGCECALWVTDAWRLQRVTDSVAGRPLGGERSQSLGVFVWSGVGAFNDLRCYSSV
jgi:hypothetical protein